MSDAEQSNGQRPKTKLCHFCGRTWKDAGPFVEGTGLQIQVFICRNCVDRCGIVLEEERKKNLPKKETIESIPTPRQIAENLDSTVIGQAAAKRKLAIAVSRHFKRLQ